MKQKPATENLVAAPAEQVAAKPKIQIVVLLDTSSSMDGLINQARTQLWKMVNELGKANVGSSNRTWKSRYSNTERWLASQRRLHPPNRSFHTDLDKISKELFALVQMAEASSVGK